MPIAGSQATSCILPGLYVASVPGPLMKDGADSEDVDVLSGELQAFSVKGEGTANRALALLLGNGHDSTVSGQLP